MEEQSLKRLIRKITQATRETPDVTSNLLLTDGKNPCHYRCKCRVIWTDGAEKGYTGVVGKLTDITDDYMVMENVREEGLKVLEKDRSADFMTDLRNAASLQMERKRGFCFSTCRYPMIWSDM